MYDPPIEVKEQFISGGWFPGRLVQVPLDLQSQIHATEILKRYSGLMVGKCGSGKEVSSSDIEFRIPQSDNSEEYDKKSSWEYLLKIKLISIGHVHHQHGEIFIGSDGRCYGRSYMVSAKESGGWRYFQQSRQTCSSCSTVTVLHSPQPNPPAPPG